MKTIVSLERAVERHWWVMILRGIAAILLGLGMLAWPDVSIGALVLTFGVYCLVDGAVALSGGFGTSFWQSIATGGISILAGVMALAAPRLTAVALLYLMAVWSMARGIIEIAAAIAFRKVIDGEWRLVLAGVASFLFGLFIALNPGAGASVFVMIVSAYIVLFGALLAALGLRLRELADIHRSEGAFQHVHR
jgi:uncharacterized membrane protein HdeD (DUF308 family)